jgi:hypothetical protein
MEPELDQWFSAAYGWSSGGGNDFQLNDLLFSLFYLNALPMAFVRFEEVRLMVVVFQIFPECC